MLFEIIIFLTTFIASSGLAAIGILITYQQFQTGKSNIYQSLLYQQIFLFSFFFYSIWGNLAIRVIVREISMNSELITRLSFFLPLLGLPFLLVSWFMLIKYSFLVRGKKLSKTLIYSYYSIFLLSFVVVAFLFYTGSIAFPQNPDAFLLKLYVSANLIIHLLFLVQLLKSAPRLVVQVENEKWVKVMLIYLGGTLFYTAAIYFSGLLGNIYTAGSILLMFAVSILLPVGMKYSVRNAIDKEIPAIDNFEAFCVKYEISKREAEIINEICTGKSNQAIADKLFITLQTVKDHTHRIYTKTQVKSRVQLANLVREKTGRLKTPIHR